MHSKAWSFGTRNESGEAQPSIEAIKKIALAFHLSADWLIFEEDEREPKDDLKLKFEAVQQLDNDERHVIITVIDSMLLKHQAKQFFIPVGTKLEPQQA